MWYFNKSHKTPVYFFIIKICLKVIHSEVVYGSCSVKQTAEYLDNKTIFIYRKCLSKRSTHKSKVS